jgi:carbamoyl-phosphate synthase large subunit
MVIIRPSEIADAAVDVYNSDGTYGGLGGNALRCVAKYLYDNGLVRGDSITVEADGSVKSMKVYTTGDKVSSVTVDMGKAVLDPAHVPVLLDGERVISRKVDVAGGKYEITCVSVGNPHCVVFMHNLHDLDIAHIGPRFEHDPLFPERTNTEFVLVLDANTLSVRVWERGNGETMACGTGACAAVVAAVENGYCKKDTDVTVKLKGGDLKVRYTDEGVFMTGDANTCYDGVVEI